MAAIELLEGGYIRFENNSKVITSKVSDHLTDIIRIVDFDHGFLTFDAKYCTMDHEVEEYLDLVFELMLMDIEDECDEYFGDLRKEDICVRKN